MIDVSHDRDDRRTVFEKIDRFLDDDFRFFDDFLDLMEAFVLIAFFAFENEAVDFANFGCDFGF